MSDRTDVIDLPLDAVPRDALEQVLRAVADMVGHEVPMSDGQLTVINTGVYERAHRAASRAFEIAFSQCDSVRTSNDFKARRPNLSQRIRQLLEQGLEREQILDCVRTEGYRKRNGNEINMKLVGVLINNMNRSDKQVSK